MVNDFKEDSFKELIRNKKELIDKKYKAGFAEKDNFKRLLRNLISYQHRFGLKEFRTIVIKKDDILKLVEDLSQVLNETLNAHDAITNNHLFVDENFKLIKFNKEKITDNNDARKIYTELTDDYCVFLLNPRGVHYFVDGFDLGGAVFFTQDEFDSYSELKDISELLDVLEEYRHKLSVRSIYRQFFVSKSAKRALHSHMFIKDSTIGNIDDFLKSHNNLLENKPEDYFRESLRIFLKEKLKNKILLGKEHVLESFKRLDILIFDNFGELYFIEVKWVGTSVHSEGAKIGTSYNKDHINPAAVKQTINYIKELYEDKNKIKIGYLAVFDARYEDLEDTLVGFDKDVLENKLKTFHHRYNKILDFRVQNSHTY